MRVTNQKMNVLRLKHIVDGKNNASAVLVRRSLEGSTKLIPEEEVRLSVTFDQIDAVVSDLHFFDIDIAAERIDSRFKIFCFHILYFLVGKSFEKPACIPAGR